PLCSWRSTDDVAVARTRNAVESGVVVSGGCSGGGQLEPGWHSGEADTNGTSAALERPGAPTEGSSTYATGDSGQRQWPGAVKRGRATAPARAVPPRNPWHDGHPHRL